jgi:hypothetical protein
MIGANVCENVDAINHETRLIILGDANETGIS